MNRFKFLFAILFFFIFCAKLQADVGYAGSLTHGYYGLSVGTLKQDEFDVASIDFAGGFDLSDYLSIEGHLGTSDTEEFDIPNSSLKAESKIDYYASLLLRFNLRMKKVRPYFYLGATSMRISDTDPILETSTDTSQTGLSYGAGVDLFSSQHTSWYLAYGRLLEKEKGDDNINLNSVQIGFRYFISPQRFSKMRTKR